MDNKKLLTGACLAELIGTFFLVFFGVGSVFVAALTGALQGLFQVAIVWGLVIALGIYATSIISGILNEYERAEGIVRGQAGSEKSAMVFGEYFPNPGSFGTDPKAYATVSHIQAMATEAIGTAILVFFIFALTDMHNANRPNGSLFALFIDLTITILISVIAPITQAGFNPARDFGPRLFAWLAGRPTVTGSWRRFRPVAPETSRSCVPGTGWRTGTPSPGRSW
ncbi:aquaporin [Solidesulfovibrio sp.]|uniref:MIP/aquaporin family protein n=1 Tax=Solidesulfovibrio sp. TaxID=2910990 RepID=UPI003158891F